MSTPTPKITPLVDPVARPGPVDNPCAACAIRDLSVCGALKPDEISRLNAIVVQKTVNAGETLFIEGDPADAHYIVLEGCIKLYKMLPDGRRQITGFLFRADFLGLAFRQRYAYGAEAVSTATLCRFPRERLEALLDEFPEMERRLLSISSSELASAQDQMLLLGRKTAAEKLASFLWLLSKRAALKETDWRRLDLPMMRSDIGDYLGLTIETVSRTFTQFKKSGLVSFTRPDAVQLDDLEGLANLAGVEESWQPSTAL
jgi:CRP/FNR family transcriptional regulator